MVGPDERRQILEKTRKLIMISRRILEELDQRVGNAGRRSDASANNRCGAPRSTLEK